MNGVSWRKMTNGFKDDGEKRELNIARAFRVAVTSDVTPSREF